MNFMPTRKKTAGRSYNAPVPISAEHDLSGFDSGEPSLDEWLRRRALKNEVGGASRTYVVCQKRSKRVVAYYCLATGAVAHSSASGRIRRNMPDPIPAMVVGRLAVDRNHREKGIGQALVRDAALRTLQAASIAGIRVILVHAISHQALRFYERFGFRPSPVDPMTAMISIADAERAIGRN
jgi:predicted N-acetyltransferase YhbS